MNMKVSKLRKSFKDPHYLINTSDSKTLFLRAWNPPTASDTAVLILHGITAYSGPYKTVGIPLSQAGYSVFGLDLRGHGLSDGKRGDYPSKQRLIKDLCEIIAFLKEKFSTIVLLGHSLGVASAIIAVNHCLENIDGLVLLSAGRTVRPGVYRSPAIVEKLKILFSSLFFPSNPVISYYRDGMTGLDDPLYNFTYTLRFMRIFSAKKLKFPELTIPVIFGIGDHDEIFTVESAQSLFNEIPSDNKEFVVIPGANHAEFPEGSFQELITWLTTNFK